MNNSNTFKSQKNKKIPAKDIFKNFFLSRQFLLIVVIIIIIIITSSQSKAFFTMANISGILFYFSVYSIMAMGLLVLFISGGFDMSIGTHLSFIGVILGILLGNKVPVPLAIFITLCVGLFDGFIMGMLVTKLRVNAFVTTLGALFIFRGLAFIIGVNSAVALSSSSVPYFKNFPESFTNIAGGKFYGFEYIDFYALAILILFFFLLKKNTFFRQNYFLGGNPRAAKLAGIKTNFLIVFNFMLIGLMVSVATILRASRIESHTSVAGSLTLGLAIVTAVIIGGASLKGGSGSVTGTVLGVLLLVLITNFVNMTSAPSVYSNIILGGILFVSIFIDQLIKIWNFKLFKRFAKKT